MRPLLITLLLSGLLFGCETMVSAQEAARPDAKPAPLGPILSRFLRRPKPTEEERAKQLQQAATEKKAAKERAQAAAAAKKPAALTAKAASTTASKFPATKTLPVVPQATTNTAPAVPSSPVLPPIPRDPAIVSVLVSEKKPATTPWKPLFNGKDLTHWESSKFGGDGEIEVAEGAIVLEPGGDLTGVTFTGEVPKMNYALEVEAQRLEGLDFFAGITFPVADSHATLVPGGWAGGVFGLSCINGLDASENETTQARIFEDKRWYTFRIHVTEARIQVWVDQKLEIDLITTDKKLTTRGEVENSKPLGISSWRTKAAIRSIRLRPLSDAEVLAAAPKK